jgi:SAM-dependent methyltransferase
MSNTDRTIWDDRYRAGAFSDRIHPSEFLVKWLPRIPPGRALDVACGAGRNSLHLAQAGFQVDAVDVSAVALKRARQSARERGLEVNWIESDLDAGIPGDERYDLIVVMRYVNVALLESLPGRLRPGGYLVCEEHLWTTEDVTGPRNPRFLLQPGRLERVASTIEVVFYDEGVHARPDGRSVALARLVAQAEAQ